MLQEGHFSITASLVPWIRSVVMAPNSVIIEVFIATGWWHHDMGCISDVSEILDTCLHLPFALLGG
jgi:hypothetical protein